MNLESQFIINRLIKNWIRYSTKLINQEELYFINNLGEFKTTSFEAPDLIFEWSSQIFWFEHFAVDGAEIKKGSKIQKEYNDKIKKGINIEVKNELKSSPNSVKNHHFTSKISYNNLTQNIYSNFEKHYKKIELYEENIKKRISEKKDINIIFFIEYRDLLPHILLSKWKPEKDFLPHMEKTFLDYFRWKNNIFGIIFSSSKSNTFIPILNTNYPEIDWYIEDIDDSDIFSFQPNCISFWIKI